MTKAYFDCVNDNGGINGRPIQYIDEDEHVDPQQIAASGEEARSSRTACSGFVGNTSIIDCSVNGKYYADNGFFPIIAGVDQACFTTPNFSAVNMGPYYSSLGGAQAALRAGAKGTMVVIVAQPAGLRRHQQRRHRLREAERHEGRQPDRGRPDRRPGGARPEARAGRR